MFVFHKLVLIILTGVIAYSTQSVAVEIRDTQEALIAWIDTEKTIAETEAEWVSEKGIVTDLIKLLENENEKLTASVKKLEDSDNATDKVRTQLNSDKERLVASNEALATVIPKLELKTRLLLAKLPKPLLKEIDPLIRRLPKANAESHLPVSQRLLTVVGILNKIDKFNIGITVKSEIRSVADSSSEVTTLYFGLAGAYFSNNSGSYAGYGQPTADGWEWTESTDETKAILQLISSYKGTSEAKFVELPVTVH